MMPVVFAEFRRRLCRQDIQRRAGHPLRFRDRLSGVTIDTTSRAFSGAAQKPGLLPIRIRKKSAEPLIGSKWWI